MLLEAQCSDSLVVICMSVEFFRIEVAGICELHYFGCANEHRCHDNDVLHHVVAMAYVIYSDNLKLDAANQTEFHEHSSYLEKPFKSPNLVHNFQVIIIS
jgi:hypothetical protein